MNYAMATDEELMISIAQKEGPALAELSDRYVDQAVNFCNRMVRAHDVAEDIVQEAFIKVWNHAGGWKPTAKFKTWFFTILYNASLNAIRRRKSHGESELADVHVSNQMPQDEQLAHAQISRKVAVALNALPERQKSAVLLCYYEEMTQREAASILGVTVSALESLLSRGRKTLQLELQALVSEQEVHNG